MTLEEEQYENSDRVRWNASNRTQIQWARSQKNVYVEW